MKNLELNRQYQEIAHLINSTDAFTNQDIELQGHWGKYLCVLAAGFLENAISDIYTDFVTNSSSPQVCSFANKTLKKIQNPKAQKFIDVAYSFKKEWGEELEQYFSAEQANKEAINSIMTNRHQIAHGKSTSISVIRVKDYLEKSVVVVEFIENQCNVYYSPTGN